MGLSKSLLPLSGVIRVPLMVYSISVILTPDNGLPDILLTNKIECGYSFDEVVSKIEKSMIEAANGVSGIVWAKLLTSRPLMTLEPGLEKIDELALFGDVIGMEHALDWYGDTLEPSEKEIMTRGSRKMIKAFLSGRSEDGNREKELEVGSDEWVDKKLDEYFENGVKENNKRKKGKK